MSSYELLFLHNIPFLVTPGANNLYYYDAEHIGDGTEPIHLGTYTGTTLHLSEGWKERIQSRVDAFHGALKPTERGIVQPRAPKPSKPKRTTSSPKSTAAATNTVIMPTTTNSAKGRKGRPPSTRPTIEGIS